MLSAQQKSFINTYLPYAKEAEAQTNVPAPVILAQWLNETAAGTSNVFKTKNNFAGIIRNGSYQTYPTIQAGVDDYIRVMKLGYYDKVRSAGSIEGASKALVESPWAGSHYDNGKSLYPLVSDTFIYLSGKTTNGTVSDVSSFDGGLSSYLTQPVQSTSATTTAQTDYSQYTGKGAVIAVVSIAALIACILIFRAVTGNKTVKAVVTKGALSDGTGDK